MNFDHRVLWTLFHFCIRTFFGIFSSLAVFSGQTRSQKRSTLHFSTNELRIEHHFGLHYVKEKKTQLIHLLIFVVWHFMINPHHFSKILIFHIGLYNTRVIVVAFVMMKNHPLKIHLHWTHFFVEFQNKQHDLKFAIALTF